MRKRIFTAIVLAAFTSCQQEPGNKDELKTLLMTYYEALAKKDTQKMQSVTTSNFILYDEGVIYNNESAVKFAEQLPPFTASFTFDSLNTHIDKTNASAYYLRQAVFQMNDSTYPPVRFLESATFNKEGGRWKIRFIHSSLRK